MIDTKELRRGNYAVDRHGNLCQWREDESGSGIWAFYQLDETELISWGYLFVDPIPITPEWLERLGFERIDYGGVRVGGVDEMDCAGKYVKGDITIYYLKKFWVKIDGRYIWIESIHQLQNLYHALTGQELQMKDKDYGHQ